MKIVYYIDSVIPSEKANTVHVMKMCQAFKSLGHDVTLVCEKTDDKDSIDDIWTKYAIKNKFIIERVKIPNLLRKYGHRVGTDYGSWLKSKVNVDADCAYSRSSTTLYFIKNRIKFIFEAHMEPDKLSRLFIRPLISHPNCVGIVVISEALKKRYLELFPALREDRVTVLHDCADIPSAENSETIALLGNTDKLKIGYLGHLYPGKCMETLIPLAEQLPDEEFHVVGGTEYWVKYWKEVIDEKKLKNVFLYGFVNNSEIGKYYRAFDLCVLPFSSKVNIGKNKRTDIGKWISPLKLFEAMSYAKPIVVSSLSSIQEVMTDRVDCLFAEPDNVDDWVIKVNEVIEDETLRKQLGSNAYDKLTKKYTWRSRAERIIELFRECEK